MQLKFRAWDSINKQWCKENVYIHTSGLLMGDEDYYELDATEPKICLMGVEVNQFTGLVDSKGVEIYTGDIVKGRRILDNFTQIPELTVPPYDEYREIKFDVTAESVKLLLPKDISYSERSPANNIKWEVVGNIYENPELKSLIKHN